MKVFKEKHFPIPASLFRFNSQLRIAPYPAKQLDVYEGDRLILFPSQNLHNILLPLFLGLRYLSAFQKNSIYESNNQFTCLTILAKQLIWFKILTLIRLKCLFHFTFTKTYCVPTFVNSLTRF